MLKEIAILSPLYITFFWALVFCIQKGAKDWAKIHLGFFMLTAFVLYFTHAIFFNRLYGLYSYLEGLYLLTYLSVYPIYFGYLRILSAKELSHKSLLIHLLPATFLSILALVTTLILTPEERILYVKEVLIEKNLKELKPSNLVELKGIIFLFSRGVFILQAIYYMIRGILIARKHNKRIENYYSNTEGKTLHWVVVLHVILLVVSISSITFASIGRSYFMKHEISLIIPSGIFSIFLFMIGFYGNRQIYVTNEEILNENVSADVPEKKQLKNRLIKLFKEDEVYKNHDLRITTVAEILNTNRTYISNLINAEFQMNFNEFVNKYRVETALKLLSDENGNKFTLEHIADISGFGSVNSFSRVFKMFEGISPGKFRENSIRKTY